MAVRKYIDYSPALSRASGSGGATTSLTSQTILNNYVSYIKRTVSLHDKYFGNHLKLFGALNNVTDINLITSNDINAPNTGYVNEVSLRVLYFYRGVYISLVFRSWRSGYPASHSYNFNYHVSTERNDLNANGLSDEYLLIRGSLYNATTNNGNLFGSRTNDSSDWNSSGIPNIFYEDDKSMWLITDLGRSIYTNTETATVNFIALDFKVDSNGVIDTNDITLIAESSIEIISPDRTTNPSSLYVNTYLSDRPKIKMVRMTKESGETEMTMKYFNFTDTNIFKNTFELTDENSNPLCYEVLRPTTKEGVSDSLEGFLAAPITLFEGKMSTFECLHKGVTSKFLVPKYQIGDNGILRVDKSSLEYGLALKWND